MYTLLFVTAHDDLARRALSKVSAEWLELYPLR